MSVFRVITRIIPLNSNETSFEPVPFDLLTGGISKQINVLNMTEPQSGVTYRIERIEDIQNVGPGETVESINKAFSEKLKTIPGFVQLRGNDAQTDSSDKSFQFSLPQVVSLKKDSSTNENPNSLTISLVKNTKKPSKGSRVSKNDKKGTKKHKVSDDIQSSKDKKESKKKHKTSDDIESSNEKRELKKKIKISDDIESSNEKRELKKKIKISDDMESSNEKKELKKKRKISDDMESSNEKKELKKKRKISDDIESSNEKIELKKKNKISGDTVSLHEKKESKKKHKTSDDTKFTNKKKESKKKLKTIDDVRSLNKKKESKKKHKLNDDIESLETLNKSKSPTVKKSLKVKYKLGKNCKILRKSLSPSKPKHNIVNNLVQPTKSTKPSTVTSLDALDDNDLATEPPAAVFSEQDQEKCESLNVSETKIKNDTITSVNKDKNVSVDDSSNDMECGDLVINVPEALDANSNSQQIASSINNCDKFNHSVTSDFDLSSSTPLKGSSSTIENVIVDDSSQTDSNQMLESNSVDSMSIDNCNQFVVPVEHPFFDLLQALKKYFVSGECLICGFIPEDEDYNAAEHMETHISSNSAFCFYKCICCSEKFYSPRNLYMHALSREKSYKYMCDICLLKFKRKHYLLRHNAKSHSSASKSPIDTNA